MDKRYPHQKNPADYLPQADSASKLIAIAITKYTGVWGRNEVTHLLKRTMFGARKQDVTYFLGMTMDQAVDEILFLPATMPAPPLKDYTDVAAGDPDTTVAYGSTWVNTPTNSSDVDNLRRRSFRTWYMGVLINHDRNIKEKMTLFWHNHFSTEAEVVHYTRFTYRHHDMLRRNALGNFKNLVKEITIDPGMLVYLNGNLNSKEAPDENYARELQELFTIGKDNPSSYSEDDVKNAARVLTGWRYDIDANSSYFDQSRHDKNDKSFSSFYNNTTITGRGGSDAGNLELDDLLNMIFSKQAEVSRFMVRKLYRWFVHSNITDTVEQQVIIPLAQVMVDNNWEIKPVLKALFTSADFYNPINYGALIKSPVDFVVGLLRECNVVLPDAGDFTNTYAHFNNFRMFADLMSQSLGDPPDVAGWKAYYQKPFFYEMWINSDTYPRRLIFTDEMCDYGYVVAGKAAMVDRIKFIKTLNNPSDPNMMVKELCEIFFRTDLTQESRDQIKREILLQGQTNDYYWTELWTSYISSPNDTWLLNTVNDRLRDILKYLMGLAEYQLM